MVSTWDLKKGGSPPRITIANPQINSSNRRYGNSSEDQKHKRISWGLSGVWKKCTTYLNGRVQTTEHRHMAASGSGVSGTKIYYLT